MDFFTLAVGYNFTSNDWIIAGLAVFLMGLNRAGIKGIDILFITLMTLVIEGKWSTGIVLPMLIVGDILGVIYYRRSARWDYIVKLIPPMIIGIFVGAAIGQDLSQETFRKVIAGIIIISLLLMLFWEKKKSKEVPTHWGFASFMGLSAGIITMIGNLAGAFANVYFLAIRLPKNEFIGTSVWLFFIVNLIKLPFHIFVWKTINTDSLTVNLRLFPMVLIGFVVGLWILKKVEVTAYRKMVMILTAFGAAFILFSK